MESQFPPAAVAAVALQASVPLPVLRMKTRTKGGSAPPAAASKQSERGSTANEGCGGGVTGSRTLIVRCVGAATSDSTVIVPVYSPGVRARASNFTSIAPGTDPEAVAASQLPPV